MRHFLALLLVSLAIMGGAALADTRSDVQAAFVRCNVFADDRTWLNCIYGAAQPIRSKLGLPPAPDSQINLVPSEPLMLQSSSSTPSGSRSISKRSAVGSFLFGGEAIVRDVQMDAYNIDRSGLFTITLRNGQVWREIEGSPTPQWRGPAAHFLVSVSTGAFNSYNLLIAGEGVKYKVKRLR